jgi:Fe-S cluster assembly protein SufD
LQSRLLTSEPVHRLVFVDGHHAPELSPFNTLLNGVTLTGLAFALVNRPEELESWLGSKADLEKPGFNAFNTAFMSDGAYIRLAPGTVLEQPVHLLFIATGRPDTVATVRNLIVAEAGSKAQIIESYVSLNDAAYMTSTVTELITGDGADIEHYKLEQESESAYHMAGIYVSQHRDSRYTSHNIALGGRLVRNDLQVMLDGPGADCTLNGLYLTRGRQHVDNHTRIDHCKPVKQPGILQGCAGRTLARHFQRSRGRSHGRPADRCPAKQPQPAAVERGRGRCPAATRDPRR